MSGKLLWLEAGPYRASVHPLGAELQSFAWQGRDLLWEGDPAWWGRRAPLLFPVVGAVAGGRLRVEGRHHPMPKHGFARDRAWEVVEVSASACSLRLRDDAETRALYPFAFELRLSIELRTPLGGRGEAALTEAGLRLALRLHNPGPGPLPAQFGFHPAFRWPLLAEDPREAHRLRFDAPEPGPLRRLDRDLLAPEARPTPVAGDALPLRDALFGTDALIWEAPASRGLRYGVPGRPNLRLRWDLPSFACWTKPGAPFLCLEPWQGLADRQGADGDITARPGLVLVPPGGTAGGSLELSVEA